MVEAAGQLVWPFRTRLDYAFTPTQSSGAGRVIRRSKSAASDPSAGSAASSSAGLWVSTGQAWGWPSSYPSALPRTAIFGASGFTDVSPVVTSPSRVKATHLDRTRVRKPYVPGPTCLAVSLYLVERYPSGREDVRPAQVHFSEPALSTLDPRACERVPRVWMHKHMPVEG